MSRWQVTGIVALLAAVGLALAGPALHPRRGPRDPDPEPAAMDRPVRAIPEVSPISTSPAGIPELREPPAPPRVPTVRLPPDPPEPQTHVGCGGVEVPIDRPVPACGMG